MAQLLSEAYRLQLMRGLERLLYGCGYARLAGVDEAGRGALAGPVAAAAVLVEGERTVPGVDDSKCLKPQQRERLAAVIAKTHPIHAVILVSPQEIDRINILQATRLAMRRALAALDPAPEMALIDAVGLDDLPYPSLPLVRGDQISYPIACASILAKVERDRVMVELDRRYPHYGWRSNKGYGAASHRQALVEYGPSPVHRLTFRSVVQRQATLGGR
jgi:ribonuclease HII